MLKWYGAIFIIFIVFGYLGILIYMTYPISEYTIEKSAQLGDSFGIINSLFSGLAFVALVITIYLQQKDIKKTNKNIEQQNFENSFFKMFDLFTATIKDLTFERPKEYTGYTSQDNVEEFNYTGYKILNEKMYIGEKDYQGREVLSQLLKLFNFYKKVIEDNKNDKKCKVGIYEDFYDTYESILGHYFGIIYQILKFVDTNNVTNKKTYINLFKTQFSQAELELLSYHRTSEIAKSKFTPLLIKYEFFEHLKIDNLHDNAIKIYINETKKLNKEYLNNKVFEI